MTHYFSLHTTITHFIAPWTSESSNDVAVFWSRGDPISDRSACGKLKHQIILKLSIVCFEIRCKNDKIIYFIKKVLFLKLKHCNNSAITDKSLNSPCLRVRSYHVWVNKHSQTLSTTSTGCNLKQTYLTRCVLAELGSWRDNFVIWLFKVSDFSRKPFCFRFVFSYYSLFFILYSLFFFFIFHITVHP